MNESILQICDLILYKKWGEKSSRLQWFWKAVILNNKLIEKIIQHYLCAVVGKSVSHRGTKIEQISKWMVYDKDNISHSKRT